MNKKKISIRQITIIGVMTAIICVLAPFSVPIGAVPLSLATLVIYIAVYVLGSKRAVICCLVYLLIGLVGLPVFSGFAGGIGKLVGPTGGYLIGYLGMAWIAGIFVDRFLSKWYLCFAGLLLGTLFCYLLGTLWLAYAADMNPAEAMLAGVIPFIPGDLLKIILAMLVGPKLKRRLQNAGVETQ